VFLKRYAAAYFDTRFVTRTLWKIGKTPRGTFKAAKKKKKKMVMLIVRTKAKACIDCTKAERACMAEELKPENCLLRVYFGATVASSVGIGD
jgi:hypothetical protein